MNDHLSPVGKPAPPRPRSPEAFTSLMIQSRAFKTPVVETIEIGENAVLVLEHHDFPLADESAAGGFGTGASRRFAAVPGVLASASSSAGCSPCPGLRRA